MLIKNKYIPIQIHYLLLLLLTGLMSVRPCFLWPDVFSASTTEVKRTAWQEQKERERGIGQ